jgi:hypothetical protein
MKIDELFWELEPDLIHASPEQRIIYAVLLQAIAEQEPTGPTIGQQRIAADARRFCQSSEYLRLCRLVHFDPERRTRPDLAKTALTLIEHLRGTKEAQSLELMEQRCRRVERQCLHVTPAPKPSELDCDIPPLPIQTPRNALRRVGGVLDFTGATIGYLRVLGRIAGTLTWEAMCSCGKRCTVSSNYLQSTPEASCPDCGERRKAIRRSEAADEPERIHIPELSDEEYAALCGEEF